MSGSTRFSTAAPHACTPYLSCGIVRPAFTWRPDDRLRPNAVPHVPHGHAFEEFEPGRTFEHHWGRTLNEGDNSLFTTATLAYNPLYFNAEYARAHGPPETWWSTRCSCSARSSG